MAIGSTGGAREMLERMRKAKCTHDFSWENPTGRESTELFAIG